MKQTFLALIFLLIMQNGNAQIIDTLVNLKNHKLHFKILKGKGIPILFEAGNGDNSNVWNDILYKIHDATGATLITYDRAGLGLSEIDTLTINMQNEVRDLEIALNKLGYNNEIFIVNHSFGSYYSLLFALDNEEKITGTVFIDPLLPCYWTEKRAIEFKSSVTRDQWKILKEKVIGLYYVVSRFDDITKKFNQKKFPNNIPATVIGAENPPRMVSESNKSEWIDCIKSFGNLQNHKYVFVEGSTHKIWETNPEVIIDEIIMLYNNATAGK